MTRKCSHYDIDWTKLFSFHSAALDFVLCWVTKTDQAAMYFKA